MVVKNPLSRGTGVWGPAPNYVKLTIGKNVPFFQQRALVGREGRLAPESEERLELVEEGGILGKDSEVEKTLRPKKRRGFQGSYGFAKTGLG